MLEFYLIGVGLVFVMNLNHIRKLIFSYSAVRNHNLSKINFFIDRRTLHVVSEKPSYFSFPLHMLELLMVKPALSWINVGFALPGLIKVWSHQKVAIPNKEKIAAIDFQLNSIDLPRRKVKDLLHQLLRTMFEGSIKIGDLYLFRHNPEYELDRSDSFAYHIATVYPVIQQFEGVFSIRDDPFLSKHIFEYKFESDKELIILFRLKTDTIVYPDKSSDVLDGVVQETAIRRNALDDKSAQECIARLKAAVEWRPVQDLKLRYLLLDCHPEVIEDEEFLKLVRNEIEQIEKSVFEVDKFVEKFGSNIRIINDEETGYRIRLCEALQSKHLKAWTEISTRIRNASAGSEVFPKFEEVEDEIKAMSDPDLVLATTLRSNIFEFEKKLGVGPCSNFSQHKDLIKFFNRFISK